MILLIIWNKMEQLIKDSKSLINNDNSIKSKIMIWRGEADVVNKAIRDKNIKPIKNWLYWLMCFKEFDQLITQIKTTDEIIVQRDISVNLYDNLQINDIISVDTYMSTSRTDVINKKDIFGDIHMKIILPVGTNSFYYSVVDDEYHTEYEVLIPPCQMQFLGFSNRFYNFIILSTTTIIPLLHKNNLIESWIDINNIIDIIL